MEPRLEVGEGATPVGLRGVALHHRLEPEAGDRPGQVEHEGEGDDRGDAADGAGRQPRRTGEHERAVEHRPLVEPTAEARRGHVAGHRPRRGGRDARAQPGGAGVLSCTQKAIRKNTKPTDARSNIITIEPSVTRGECTSLLLGIGGVGGDDVGRQEKAAHRAKANSSAE